MLFERGYGDEGFTELDEERPGRFFFEFRLVGRRRLSILSRVVGAAVPVLKL